MIQGFGNVGSVAARLLERLGLTVIGVSDKSAALYNPNGLSTSHLGRWIEEHRYLVGYPNAEQISADELFTLECDVLVGNEHQRMGIAQAAGLMQKPDDGIRKNAWSAINEAWAQHEESCAAAVNAIAGWRLEIPDEGLIVDLQPTVADQELDTRATTGVIYWEGSQVVRAERDGVVLGGAAYVELTGYGPDQVR